MENKIPHIKYPKIETITDADDSLNNENVVILEKIHGSNLSFIFNPKGEHIATAKRNSLVDSNENFYNVHNFSKTNNIISNMSLLTKYICSQNSNDIYRIRYYGEYYGGCYNGITASNAKKIQNNMNYSENNEFAVFDILLECHFEYNNETHIWLSWDDVKNYTDKFGVPHVPELLRDTWSKIKEEFDLQNMISVVPKQLTGFSGVDNPEAEGVIVKVLSPKNLSGFTRRYKWKKNKYCETPSKRIDPITNKRKTIIIEWMNENRFNNYKSKVGIDFIIDKQNMVININNLKEDVLEDVEVKYGTCEKKFIKSLGKPLSKKARQLILKFIANPN